MMCESKTIRFLVAMAVMVAFVGLATPASAAAKSAGKPAVKETAKPAAKENAKPAAKENAKPAGKETPKSVAKAPQKPAMPTAKKETERKKKAQGDMRLRTGKNAAVRGKAA